MFDGYNLLQDRVLLIDENGTVVDVVPAKEVGADAEKLEGLLIPGFINCHCHLELSHMKGKIPERTGLVDFVFKVVTERGAQEEEILEAIAKAEAEMRKGGIVAVGDICNNTTTIPQKQQGNLQYYNFIEASGWLPSVSEMRFERAKKLYDEFAEIQNSKAKIQNSSIVPHAPYSVSENLWNSIQPFFENKIVSVHNQETQYEDDFFLEGTGDFRRMYELMKIDNSHHAPTKKSSLQSYFEKLAGAKNIILVHDTFTKQEDIDFVNRVLKLRTPGSQPQTFFCLCVNANQYIEDALPPIELFRRNNCTIVLGTDSLASNWSLSILDKIKTIRKNLPKIPLEEILGWATINGAKALGVANALGSFEKGKRPGAALIAENLDLITTLL